MSSDHNSKKRHLESHALAERNAKDQRSTLRQPGPRHSSRDVGNREYNAREGEQSFAREQTRLNQIQEAERMREWISKEDEFVLKQSKKKARIRVREGRAKTIDWLVVTLGAVDGERDPLEDDEEDGQLEVIDPSGVFEGLSLSQLHDLGSDIDTFLLLEVDNRSRKYWIALKTICKDYEGNLAPSTHHSLRAAATSISADIDKLLAPKTLKELEKLETQVKNKLQSREPIDVEYWEQLLRSVGVFKSRAELSAVYRAVIQDRLDTFQDEQCQEALSVRSKLGILIGSQDSPKTLSSGDKVSTDGNMIPYTRSVDPEPMLRLRPEDRSLELVDENEFLAKIVCWAFILVQTITDIFVGIREK